jgi:hypothetical protein
MRSAGRDGAARRRRMRRASRPDDVVAVQVILPHQPDELRAIAGIRGIDARQGGREGVRVMTVSHRPSVVPACCEQPAVIVDALSRAVIDPERGRGCHRLAIGVLVRWQRIAAGRAAALDPEQVVVLGSQAALTPRRLIDGLGNRHRRRHAVPVLRGNRPRRDRADERLLPGCFLRRRGDGRRIVPAVARCRSRFRFGRPVVRRYCEPGDRRGARRFRTGCMTWR